MKTRATGARAKHRGFSAHAAHRNSAAASTTATHACARVSRPDGSSRARARVPRVERAVRDAIEAERHEAGAGEGEHHEPERAPVDGSAGGGYAHAEHRERQG